MSGYIGASPLTQAVQKRQSFTATSVKQYFHLVTSQDI